MTQAPAWIAAIAASSLSQGINGSLWMFAVIEVGHLLGIALFGGALLAVDLSVLGIGFRSTEIRSLEKQLRPWLWAGLWLIIGSGILMFIAEPEKCYFNLAFRFKMVALLLAALVLTTVRRGAFRRLDARAILRSAHHGESGDRARSEA